MPLVVTGILSDCVFLFFSRGLVVHASTSPTKRLALNTDIGGDAHRRTCNFPFSEWHEAKPRTSLAADMSDRRHFDLFVAFDLALLASLPLTDPQAPMVLTGSLRKWNPRPACGTAISSVRISISVCMCESSACMISSCTSLLTGQSERVAGHVQTIEACHVMGDLN